MEPARCRKPGDTEIRTQYVVLDLLDPPAACAALGDAYRVDVRIVEWDAASALRVPTSAIFRHGERWAVYRAIGGGARLSIVEIGHQAGQLAEVISGLSEDEQIVLHPADTLRDSARIVRR